MRSGALRDASLPNKNLCLDNSILFAQALDDSLWRDENINI